MNLLDPVYLPYMVFALVALVAAAAMMLIRNLAFSPADEGGEVSLQQLPFAPARPPRTFVGRFDRWFNRQVIMTGYRMTPLAAFLVAVGVGLALGGATFVWRENELIAGLVFIAGFALVMGWFVWVAARRTARMTEQLPEIMDLLARAVRAGESLDQAFTLVGDTQREPLAVEFRRCSRQLEMGLSVEAAMQSFVQHVPLTESRIFAAAITVQRRTGGNLPATMERLARVFRDRMAYQRQFRAATAAGRMSTIIIIAAAILLVAYLLVWRPDHFRTLLDSFAGRVMLVVAVVLQVIGLWWIIRLLRPER